MKRLIKSRLFIFILGLIIASATSVFAFSFIASDVGFTPVDTTWKTDEGDDIQEVETAINELYAKSKTRSDIITNVSFTSVLTNDSIKVIPTVEATDNNKIFGYHAFAIDDEQNIYLNMSTSNELTISGLTSNKKYNVYVMAYDIYNKYLRSKSQSLKTTSTLENKNYSASNGSYPYVLRTNNTTTLLTYGNCNLQLKKFYIYGAFGNSSAIYASTVYVYVYGYTNNSWELIKSFSAGRGVKVGSATIVNTTVDVSSNEKVYTNFYVSAKSSDNETYGNVQFQPTGVIMDN